MRHRPISILITSALSPIPVAPFVPDGLGVPDPLLDALDGCDVWLDTVVGVMLFAPLFDVLALMALALTALVLMALLLGDPTRLEVSGTTVGIDFVPVSGEAVAASGDFAGDDFAWSGAVVGVDAVAWA